MKSTGVVRKVDELDRAVLPKELRDTMGINEKDSPEIFVGDSTIILKNMSLRVFSVEIPVMSMIIREENL